MDFRAPNIAKETKLTSLKVKVSLSCGLIYFAYQERVLFVIKCNLRVGPYILQRSDMLIL